MSLCDSFPCKTVVFFKMTPDRGLSSQNKVAGFQQSKVRLIYLFAARTVGSDKSEPLSIGKAVKPRVFKGKTGQQVGFLYRNNAKAWMTGVLYKEWLSDWDMELKRVPRRIVLLEGNFSGHIAPDDLHNITVIKFSPNFTSHVQPLDQGIIRCFKAHY